MAENSGSTVVAMPRPPSNAVQIAIRIPEEWLSRADELASRLSRAGVAVTRTDAFRAAMARGFDEFDSDDRRKEGEHQRRSAQHMAHLYEEVAKLVKLTGLRDIYAFALSDRGVVVLTDKKRTVEVEHENAAREALRQWPGSKLNQYLLDPSSGEYVRDTAANRKRLGL